VSTLCDSERKSSISRNGTWACSWHIGEVGRTGMAAGKTTSGEWSLVKTWSNVRLLRDWRLENQCSCCQRIPSTDSEDQGIESEETDPEEDLGSGGIEPGAQSRGGMVHWSHKRAKDAHSANVMMGEDGNAQG
jgi:hypothetical protein